MEPPPPRRCRKLAGTMTVSSSSRMRSKTSGTDDDEQVVVVSLPILLLPLPLPLPSRLRLFPPPDSSCRLLLVFSAVTWHGLSSSFGQVAVGGDVAVLGGVVGVVGGR